MEQEPEPDAAPMEMDAKPADPPPQITCAGFTAVAGHSHYLLINEAAQHAAAVLRCKNYPGAHLATFETLAEPPAVAQALGLTEGVWTNVVQAQSSVLPTAGWVNRIDDSNATPVPTPFPWRYGEPNDYGYPENNEENYAELVTDVTLGAAFDDADANRSSNILCECVPTPPPSSR